MISLAHNLGSVGGRCHAQLFCYLCEDFGVRGRTSVTPSIRRILVLIALTDLALGRRELKRWLCPENRRVGASALLLLDTMPADPD
jgi:hypothetical protein